MSKQTYKKGKFAKKKQPKSMKLPALIFLDVLMVGLVLLIFAFFHHVLPSMINAYERQQELMNATEAVETLAPETNPMEPTDPVQPSETEVPETEPSATEETVPETEPDNRTEWQIKFAEHFSDEIVQTENSYRRTDLYLRVQDEGTQQTGTVQPAECQRKCIGCSYH